MVLVLLLVKENLYLKGSGDEYEMLLSRSNF